ncbi:MAG: hypothetical protein U5N55_01560 [Cypionkella sp.]|nr:hypothetical protein [Cypionkella sp.]
MIGPTKSQLAKLDAALRAMTPRVRKAFASVIEAHANSIDFAALVEALERQDTQAALRMLQFPQAMLFPLEEELRAGFMMGAATADLPRVVGGVFAFNGRHPRAEQIVRELGAALIQGIQYDTLEASRRVISAGMETNQGFRKTALEIVGRRNAAGVRTGGILGLTTQQTDAVANARAILSNPDLLADYFKADGSPRYKLSDRRFDSTIRKAIAGKVKLTAGDIDRIIAAHTSKALKYRGDLIAKNEAATAIAQGQYEAYRQMADDPRIESVELTWSHGLSVEPRKSHVAMNGVKVKIGTPFQIPADGDLPAASMLYPHDPAGGAAHTLHCRCVAIYRVKTAIDAARQAVNVPDVVALKAVPVVQSNEPNVTKGLTYRTIAKPTKVSQVNAFFSDNGISEKADFMGIDGAIMQDASIAALEAVQRFGLAPMQWAGPSSRFGIRPLKNANAAIFRSRRRDRITGEFTDHNGLHIPLKFSARELKKQYDIGQRNNARYKAGAVERFEKACIARQ